MDVAFEIDTITGELAYDDVTIILPRQQGKTELLLPVMAHRSTSFPIPQRTLYTAQTAGEARKKWEDIHVARLEDSALKSLFHVRKALQREAIVWKNGSFWMPGSTTGKTGGTGDTLDLGVIDEMWSRPDSRTEVAMKPAMQTRRNAQLWRASMVPGIARLKTHDPKYMREQMLRGRDRVERGVNTGQAYFEWSADPKADPGDPRTWLTCLPGLRDHGGLTPISAIKSSYETMDLIDFCAEYLGWMPDDHVPKWTTISKGTWNLLFDPDSYAAGQVAIGLEVDPTRTHARIAAVGRRHDGDWHIEILEPGSQIAEGVVGIDWLEDRVVDICEKHEPCAVVIDMRSPAASLVVPLRNRGIEVVTPNAQEVAAAAGMFYDGTGQKADPDDVGVRLRHLAQADMDRAVAYARTTESPTSGSFQWLRVGPVDISSLIAVTLALYGYELKRPDDYDVRDSVPDDYNQCSYCYACEIDGMLNHYPTCERPR